MTYPPTKRLFDQDSHLKSFSATLLVCTPTEVQGQYHLILDQTAFFPEGGGQNADRGFINDHPVIDVQEQNGVIIHTVTLSSPLTVGDVVSCELDWSTRHRRMQNHSGEHIISGLVHALYGYNNVGFHLGDGDVTLDFDGVLTREQLNDIEDKANRIVSACLPIKAYYPTPDVLATLDYRSKLELTHNVRMVEIGQGDDMVDRCACCAPHVDNTGEIGVIKLLDFMHYKGGVRIHMLCGLDALEDYRKRYTYMAQIAASLSVGQDDLPFAFEKLTADIEDKKSTIYHLRKVVLDLTLATIPPTDGSLCLFAPTDDPDALRHLLNGAVGKCRRLCGVFCGDDTHGYRYVIGRYDPTIDLKAYIKDINTALSAKGGGSSEMLQGRSGATKAEIQAFFETWEKQ